MVQVIKTMESRLGGNMNERIRKLLNEACRYAYEQNPGENSYGRPVDENKYNQDRDSKFAELIVRECADWVDASSPIKLGAALQKHFGVEE